MTDAPAAEIEAKISENQQRRAGLEPVAAKAKAALADARAKQEALADRLAAGKADQASTLTIASAIRDAQAHLDVVEDAGRRLDADQRRLEAEHAEALKAEAAATYEAKCDQAKRLAAALDQAASAFNEAYEAWKSAREAALAARPPSAGFYAPPQNAALVGSASLHPAIVGFFCSGLWVGSAPPRRPVMSFEQ